MVSFGKIMDNEFTKSMFPYLDFHVKKDDYQFKGRIDYKNGDVEFFIFEGKFYIMLNYGMLHEDMSICIEIGHYSDELFSLELIKYDDKSKLIPIINNLNDLQIVQIQNLAFFFKKFNLMGTKSDYDDIISLPKIISFEDGYVKFYEKNQILFIFYVSHSGGYAIKRIGSCTQELIISEIHKVKSCQKIIDLEFDANARDDPEYHHESISEELWIQERERLQKEIDEYMQKNTHKSDEHKSDARVCPNCRDTIKHDGEYCSDYCMRESGFRGCPGCCIVGDYDGVYCSRCDPEYHHESISEESSDSESNDRVCAWCRDPIKYGGEYCLNCYMHSPDYPGCPNCYIISDYDGVYCSRCDQ